MLKFFLIGFLGVLIPGPDMLLVIRISLIEGIRKAILALSGIITGNIIYILPVIMGYIFFIKNYIPYFMILGGIYITYLGWLIFNTYELKNGRVMNFQNYYLLGLFTNLSNPKAMLYFASVLLPALLESRNFYIPIIYFFVGVILAFLTLIIFANSFHQWIYKKTNLKKINIIFSAIFFVYGIYLIYTGIQSIFHFYV